MNRVMYPHLIVLIASGMMVTVSVLFKILKVTSLKISSLLKI
jgi:hypothetical protein